MQQTIDTLAELKAIRFSVFDEIFCKETSREYFFKQDGGLTPDDLEIVTTALGGNWRLVAKTGKGGSADGAGTIASQAEAEAGTENTKAMSALRTAQAIAAQVVSPVSSVHGRTGSVTAQAGDYNFDQISDGVTNKPFTATEKTKLAGITAVNKWDIRWDTYAGYGATDTKIPYFTNKNKDTSSGDLTIVNNSTNGLKLTIVTSGVYAISFWSNTAGVINCGLSLNSSQLTTGIGSITAADRLTMSDSSTGNNVQCSWVGNLAAGDIIRPHTSGASAVTAGQWGFSISKIG